MKRRPVIWTENAVDDMVAITQYIARDNPVAARKVAKTIRTTAAKLGHFAIGRPGRVIGTYEKPLIKYPYIIAYAIHPQASGKEALVVLHVIHMKRLWEPETWPASN